MLFPLEEKLWRALRNWDVKTLAEYPNLVHRVELKRCVVTSGDGSVSWHAHRPTGRRRITLKPNGQFPWRTDAELPEQFCGK